MGNGELLVGLCPVDTQRASDRFDPSAAALTT